MDHTFPSGNRSELRDVHPLSVPVARLPRDLAGTPDDRFRHTYWVQDLTAAAVNCLLTEATRNLVSAGHALSAEASASPADTRRRASPPRITKSEPENPMIGRTKPS